MHTSLTRGALDGIMGRLKTANDGLMHTYPGEPLTRQPIHTVYGGAQLFKSDTAVKLGALARRAFDEYAPDHAILAKALGFPGAEHLSEDRASLQATEQRLQTEPEALRREAPHTWLAASVYQRVWQKLKHEPVEDFRIDFEDGFGVRPDSEEDVAAVRAALALADGLAEGTLPPYIGLRIKTFSEELKHRAVRTLDLFLTTLCDKTGGKLPPNFFITLPKVTVPEQVTAAIEIFALLEKKLGLSEGCLKAEIMIETTQALIDDAGCSNLPQLFNAGKGRIVSAHFGAYDYTASCNITAAQQSMDHPACDFARHMMKIAYGSRPVWLSDGATNVMPVGPHKAPSGHSLSDKERTENTKVVHRAWKLAYDHTRHSLRNGFYQGWDLHPAQIPVRYAACYAFFLEGLDAATERLKAFMDKAAQATLLGDVFDDAATGQGLLNYFLRAMNCGAVTKSEVLQTGLSLAEVRSRSFVKILEGRRQKA